MKSRGWEEIQEYFHAACEGLTLDVERVVDDEVPVPDHRQVDRQVADVVALVVVLEEQKKNHKNMRRHSHVRTPQAIISSHQ